MALDITVTKLRFDDSDLAGWATVIMGRSGLKWRRLTYIIAYYSDFSE